eukprot:9277113-Pyramimonas_sp.AAC.1
MPPGLIFALLYFWTRRAPASRSVARSRGGPKVTTVTRFGWPAPIRPRGAGPMGKRPSLETASQFVHS